ncbi:hypothetical protein PM082_009346 [Marasmius tenuissimus]|nr:hypothetical protein PM082_009346 [Marasmius tenuissimus]
MTRIRAVRTTLYGLLISLGLTQNGLAIGLGLASGVSELGDFTTLTAYSSTLAGLSLLSWVWMIVLLAYDQKPLDFYHVLTIALPHFISIALMAIIWLVLGIMILTETNSTCKANIRSLDDSSLCALTSVTGTLTLLLCLLAIGTALSVRWTAQKSGNWRCKLGSQDGDSRLARDETLKGPMSRPTAVRTTLYSLILFFGLCQNILGLIMGVLGLVGPGQDQTLGPFGFVSAAIALLTWIWASVLLAYNRRPSSKLGITRAATHLYSLVVLGVQWLCIFIMFSTEIHQQCIVLPRSVFNPDALNFCPGVISTVIVAALIFGLMVSAAYYIFCATSRGGGKLGTSNVALFDGDLHELPEHR